MRLPPKLIDQNLCRNGEQGGYNDINLEISLRNPE